MSNIDKDIEIVKELIEHNYLEDINYLREPDGEHKKFNQAIENVLSELERYKRIANMNLKDSEEFNKNMCEHRCPIKSDYEETEQELLTYKRVAEKLANELEKKDFCIGGMDECKNRCMAHIIVWARNEVLKDE